MVCKKWSSDRNFCNLWWMLMLYAGCTALTTSRVHSYQHCKCLLTCPSSIPQKHLLVVLLLSFLIGRTDLQKMSYHGLERQKKGFVDLSSYRVFSYAVQYLYCSGYLQGRHPLLQIWTRLTITRQHMTAKPKLSSFIL